MKKNKEVWTWVVYRVHGGLEEVAGETLASSEKEACRNQYFKDGYAGTPYRFLPHEYRAEKLASPQPTAVAKTKASLPVGKVEQPDMFDRELRFSVFMEGY